MIIDEVLFGELIYDGKKNLHWKKASGLINQVFCLVNNINLK